MSSDKILLKSDAVFDKIKDRLAENPANEKQINAVFLYKITKTTSTGAPVKYWSECFVNHLSMKLFINVFFH